MLAAMRMIPPSLVLAIAALFTLTAHATPTSSSDDIDSLLAERGLLTKIDHVRQNVSQRASELVVNAMGFLGVPYKWGGTDADTGVDCSGFVVSVYQQSIGLLLPRKAEQQAAATEKIAQSDLQPGDLVFFNTMRRTFSHVGIYVGNGKFIHAPRTGAEVRLESMGGSYWQRRFDGARRVTAAAAESVQQVLPISASSFGDAASIR
jgi:cell wall-associated NlpC family hydrolase